MANLHAQFLEFKKRISLAHSQRQALKEGHNALLNVIMGYFKKKDSIPVTDFFILGTNNKNTML